jgi:hypothetical protein
MVIDDLDFSGAPLSALRKRFPPILESYPLSSDSSVAKIVISWRRILFHSTLGL